MGFDSKQTINDYKIPEQSFFDFHGKHQLWHLRVSSHRD
jgi:hypothetical protein